MERQAIADLQKTNGEDIWNKTAVQLNCWNCCFVSFTGYEKCILVAHDWGGAVAFDFLLRNPDMVDKFIFCNAPHPRAFMEGFSMKQLLMSW